VSLLTDTATIHGGDGGQYHYGSDYPENPGTLAITLSRGHTMFIDHVDRQ
jgi:hypothetical protein